MPQLQSLADVFEATICEKNIMLESLRSAKCKQSAGRKHSEDTGEAVPPKAEVHDAFKELIQRRMTYLASLQLCGTSPWSKGSTVTDGYRLRPQLVPWGRQSFPQIHRWRHGRECCYPAHVHRPHQCNQKAAPHHQNH